MTKRFIIRRIRHKLQIACFLCLFPALLSAALNAQQTDDPSKLFQVKPFGKQVVHTQAATKSKTGKKAHSKLMSSAPTKAMIAAEKAVKKQEALKKWRDPIYLVHAETLSYDEILGPDYQLVRGNVCFRHSGAKLYCDSAYFYPATNSLYAFGNAHMVQGDSLFLYAAWMFYDGNAKLAKAREKVRLENRSATLFTDSLNYDRIANIGYFFDGGLLVDANKNGTTNELSSEYGQYSPSTKEAWFKNDVKLVNPKFTMTNQQLFYNTRTKIASIVSATRIVSADSGYIATTSGTYNTDTEQSHLLKRSFVTKKSRFLTADTLDYNQRSGIGIGHGKVIIEDSLKKVTLNGEYGYSNEKKDYALITKKALLVEHSSKDTLFLHADTLCTKKDSIYNTFSAFHHVRFYRSDLQGLCDSMYYTAKDSVLRLYNEPVVWSEEQQLSGKYMELFTKNNKPQQLHIDRAALAISQETDSLYNQSSGKDLKAYFDSTNQVVKVEIDGNAETIYLPKDDKDKSITGLNRLEGSSLIMYRKDKKLEKLIVWPQPKGKFYPLEKLPGDARLLKNFVWYKEERPKNADDVFRDVDIGGKAVNAAKGKGIQVTSKPVETANSPKPVRSDRQRKSGKSVKGKRK